MPPPPKHLNNTYTAVIFFQLIPQMICPGKEQLSTFLAIHREGQWLQDTLYPLLLSLKIQAEIRSERPEGAMTELFSLY